MELHARFSTNPYPWFRWVFDQFGLPPRSRILEIGCGNGGLWAANLDRVPPGWRITLSDGSEGMLAEARLRLGGGDRRFDFAIVDAQRIPCEDVAFDAVIANHVLPHVPDLDRAVCEIARVLGPGGSLYATTVGEANMRELLDMLEPLVPGVSAQWDSETESFTLENGGAALARRFAEVAIRRREDSLVVTETEPLVAYVLSTMVVAGMESVQGFRKEFASVVEKRLASDGAVRIGKLAGMFVARKMDAVSRTA